MVNVFKYIDYRKFLEDYYDFMKQNHGKFSFRWFAKKAGYTSSGYYSNVIKGVHPLTGAYIDKFIGAIGFNELESHYFNLLVKYQNSKTVIDKKKYLDELIKIKPSEYFRLKQNHHLYYSKWYIPIVHQSLSIFSYDNDAKELSEFIRPRLKKTEVIESVQLLKKLNLILKDENGYWKPISPSSIGGTEVGVRSIRDFQKSIMEKAINSVDNVDPEKRHIITTTMTVNQNGVEAIKSLINEFQHKVISYSDNNEIHDKLYQMNVQFFPLSQDNKNES